MSARCTSVNCNQGHNCTCGTTRYSSDSKTVIYTRACTGPLKYSCAQLGVCQARIPPCSDACHNPAIVPGGLPVVMLDAKPINTRALPPGGFWFAPGAIEEAPPPEPWSVWEKALAAIAGSAGVGFLAGVATMWWRGLL